MRKGFPHPLFFVLGLLLLLFSCKKKYDYGNIVTPDLLSSQHEKMPLDVPALSGSETLSPVFLLDADGCQRLVSEINSFGLVAVSLDLSGCDVSVDAKLGAVLPSGLFSGMANLVSVILPDGLETVTEDFFSGCVNLRAVTLPRSLVAIEGHAFSDCVSLEKINAPDRGIFIFSYSGDGLEYPDGKCACSNASVVRGETVTDYAAWYMDCWKYSKSVEAGPVSFSEIWASSFQGGYGPENLSDGSWRSWFADPSKSYEDTKIVMSFTRENTISTITFRNGNGNTENFWSCNRVKDVEIYFGDEKTPECITLKDNMEPQTFRFLYGERRKKRYAKITFIIKSVYPGGKGKETCLSEITLNDPDGAFKCDSLTDKIELAFEEHEKKLFPEGGGHLVKKIWREKGRNPVAVVMEKEDPSHVDFLVFDGSSWVSGGQEIWRAIRAAESECLKSGKTARFSFGSDGDGFDLSLQMMRRVEGFGGSEYGRPYRFVFSDGVFRMTERADFDLKKIEAETSDFFSIINSLDKHGLYRIDLYGKLDREFFGRMSSVFTPDGKISRERNFILNLWNCSLADDLHGCIEEGFISGYFIQLVLPSCTRVLRRGSVTVAADLITLPADIMTIESGAFVSGKGSPFDVHANNILFDGGEPQKYKVEGNLLLESIPDSGGRKRLLLYMGQAGKILAQGNAVSPEAVVIPDNVTSLAPYSFYAADVYSLTFPPGFSEAGEKCMDMMKVRKMDLSRCDVQSFSLGTVREFGKAASANPGMEMRGNLLCISASGKMTESLAGIVESELKKSVGKKVFLDLSATTLVWDDSLRKYKPLPDFFLQDSNNLVWLMLGQYDSISSNTCRDCANLMWVGFIREPQKIFEPAFKGCGAGAKAVVEGSEKDLWEYARSKRF